MAAASTDLSQLKSGVAVLAACIVQTMRDYDETLATRFLARLDQAYQKLRDDPDRGEGIDDLELLTWVRHLVTGYDFAGGQGKPFFDEP